MSGSIRVRLTAWYTAGLAAFMAAFAVASYLWTARAMAERTDESLRETARAFAAAWAADRAQAPRRMPLPSASVRRIGAGDLEIVVFDQERRVVAASARRPGWVEAREGFPPRPDLATLIGAVAGAEGVFATLAGPGGLRRVFAVPLELGERRQIVTVAQGLDDQHAMLRAMRTAYLIAIPIALALALAGGFLLATRALAPVGVMAARARRIGASTLHERLEVPSDRDELGRLAGVFNDLLDRLDRAFDQQRQFVADASHELRTPVTIIRGEAEVALARERREPAEYRAALELIHDEARRMSDLVNDLFLLARADAGHHELSPSELYLEELVGECVVSLRTLAAARGVELRYEPDAELPFRGDEALLRRLVINLLENAIKYGAPGRPVTVGAGRRAGDGAGAADYAVTVHNEGPPIPDEVQHRVFDRFFRATQPAAEGDDARPDAAGPSDERRVGGGGGLGLAISRWIAEAHGGSLRLVRSDRSGTEFELRLPAPPAAPPR